MRTHPLFLLMASTLLLSNLNAQTLKDFYVAGGNADIGTTSQSVYEIGYGVSKYFDNGFMWGMELNGGMINAERNNGYYYGGDFKLGITPIKNFSVYGLGAVIKQDFDNGLSAGGFGYGGGAEIRLTSWFALAGEYKTYSMTYDRVRIDQDYISTLVKVKFTF
jgi:hypothetical protein